MPGSHEAGPRPKGRLTQTKEDKNGVLEAVVDVVAAVVVETGVEILAVSRVGPRTCSCCLSAEGHPMLLLLLLLLSLMLILFLLQGKSAWVKYKLQMW